MTVPLWMFPLLAGVVLTALDVAQRMWRRRLRRERRAGRREVLRWLQERA